MTDNKMALQWIEEMKAMLNPDNVVWIDGSKEQLDALRAQAVEDGTLIKLDQEKLPGCYLHRTAPNDVARVEDRTFICAKTKEAAGMSLPLLIHPRGTLTNALLFENDQHNEVGASW